MNSNTDNQNAPLFIYQPFNIIIFLSFYSPIIVATILTSLSFIFQNFKGLIYLLFLIGSCVLRYYTYMINEAAPMVYDKTICTSIKYSHYGNPSFSSFVFAFTIMYISIPMFSNGAPNYAIFTTLIAYFFLDCYIKITQKCAEASDMVLNVLVGMALSALIVSLMYSGGSAKYLFFTEVSSNKDMCYQPSKQTFKCNVYKNGELIGEV